MENEIKTILDKSYAVQDGCYNCKKVHSIWDGEYEEHFCKIDGKNYPEQPFLSKTCHPRRKEMYAEWVFELREWKNQRKVWDRGKCKKWEREND